MRGPADIVFPMLWNILPGRVRERLSSAILSLQSRTAIQVPLSPVKVFSQNEGYRKQFQPLLFQEAEPNRGELPAYSLICTCYNESETIGRWLDSVASQTYGPRELIIVDGGSTDGTPKQIELWQNRYSAKHGKNAPFSMKTVVEGRKNIAQGRNRGVREAAENVLAFADAGCELDRFWAERLLEPFAADPACELSMGWYRAIAQSNVGSALARFLVPQISAVDPATFLPSARSVAVKKAAFLGTGGFPEYLSFAGEDSLFDYYVKCQAGQTAFVPDAVAFWHMPASVPSLFRTVLNYARGDAEGGKLFWLYYVNLLRELGKVKLEAILAFLLFVFFLAFRWKIILWLALLLSGAALIRFLALVFRYRPLQESGLFSAGGISSVFGVALLVLAQGAGFTRGLLSRRNVERRRRAGAKAGHIFLIAPSMPQRGEESPVMTTVKKFLAENYFVTIVYQSHAKAHGSVSFDHQHLETYLRSQFQFDRFLEHESRVANREPTGSRLAVDLVRDSLSRELVERLRAAGFQPQDKDQV